MSWLQIAAWTVVAANASVTALFLWQLRRLLLIKEAWWVALMWTWRYRDHPEVHESVTEIGLTDVSALSESIPKIDPKPATNGLGFDLSRD